jgi:hypothetical protein
MKTILVALVVAAGLAVATAASPRADLLDGFVRTAMVGKADVASPYRTAPDPGYIRYSEYSAALPDSSCYWTRMPVYDFSHNVIGWRGRPVAVCP